MTHTADMYDEPVFDKLWNSIADKPDGGIGLGTLFHHAKQNDWTDPVGVAGISSLIDEVNMRFALIEGVGIYDKSLGSFVTEQQFRRLYSNRHVEIEDFQL